MVARSPAGPHSLIVSGPPPALSAKGRRRRLERWLVIATQVSVVLLVAPVLLGTVAPPHVERRFHGRWRGTHEGHDLVLFLGPTGECALRFERQAGRSFRLLLGKYTLLTERHPIALSIHDVPSLKHPLHSVARLVGPDELELSHFSPLWRLRPVSFEPGRTLRLRRLE
jgi:hypothetical protein